MFYIIKCIYYDKKIGITKKIRNNRYGFVENLAVNGCCCKNFLADTPFQYLFLAIKSHIIELWIGFNN